MNQIVVRDGKGKKDRITVLPEGVKPALKEHQSVKLCAIVKPVGCHTLRHYADSRIMPTNRDKSGAPLTPLQFKSA